MVPSARQGADRIGLTDRIAGLLSLRYVDEISLKDFSSRRLGDKETKLRPGQTRPAHATRERAGLFDPGPVASTPTAVRHHHVAHEHDREQAGEHVTEQRIDDERHDCGHLEDRLTADHGGQ